MRRLSRVVWITVARLPEDNPFSAPLLLVLANISKWRDLRRYNMGIMFIKRGIRGAVMWNKLTRSSQTPF
jgi:hypothetical protein